MIKKLPVLLVLLVFLLTSAHPSMVIAAPEAASTDRDITGFITGTSWYDPNACITAVSTAPVEANSTSQVENAKTIIGIAKKLDLGMKGALIGLMVGLTESGLKNYANDGTYRNRQGQRPYINTQLGPISTSLPHDAVGSDNDSVGIMQQRAVDGNWGPVDPKTNLRANIQWLMTPAYAAEAFFAMPAGKKDKKALMNVRGWESMDPALAAQRVQVSFDPSGGNYRRNQDRAQALINQYYADAPEVELPVPLASDSKAVPAIGATDSSFCGGTNVGNANPILNKILEYSWMDYCSGSGWRTTSGKTPERCDPMKMDPDYARDIARAPYKGSCAGVDCGAFVTLVMRKSGADPNYNENHCSTTCQLAYLRRNSGPSGKYIKVKPNETQPGDIAIRQGHTYFFVGNALKSSGFHGTSASASQCERAPMAGPDDDHSGYEWYRLKNQGLSV